MNVVILMLAVTACYTICSLNDKYAAAHSLFLTAPSDFFVDFHCYCHSCFPPVYPFLLLYTRYFFFTVVPAGGLGVKCLSTGTDLGSVWVRSSALAVITAIIS